MRQALSGVVLSAEAQRCNASKEELHPRHHWQGLADHAMHLDYDVAYLPVDALFQVEFQVDAHDNLAKQHEHDDGYKCRVDVVWGKLAAAVLVTEEVADDGEDGADALDWDVPFRPYYLVGVSA